MASSSTSTTGRVGKSRRKVVLVRRPSRGEQYEGRRRYCYNILLAPRWTLWSEGNPGRRFYRCRNYYQDGGCGYFEWHDGGFGERENEVIKELLNDIDNLYEENSHLRRGDACPKWYEELVALEREVLKMKSEHLLKDSEVKKVHCKFKLALATLLLTWVLLLLMYLSG
ncbi:hypothetical protein QN277_023997 [Acacia crassicarpa]|uniref:GRF-type domain-containing protein n=1 Tax=Acacia crassicarpa TaxID=499986 RepID=A0AAE1JDT5_9FABA|nr:hypothetical protein QN277_023997 [Acacia crassicarpa]